MPYEIATPKEMWEISPYFFILIVLGFVDLFFLISSDTILKSIFWAVLTYGTMIIAAIILVGSRIDELYEEVQE